MTKLISSKKYKAVYHNKLKDGDVTYYIYYRDANRKQKRLRVGKKSEGVTEAYCHQLKTQIVSSQKSGEFLPPSVHPQHQQKTITLNDVADFYFDNQSTKSKQKWLNKYNLRIRNLIGGKDINTIGIDEMESLRSSLLEMNLSPTTVNCYIDIVSAICNYALQKAVYNGKNPAKLIKKLRVDNRRERFLSKTEITELLEYLQPNPTLLLFTKLSLSTGGRLQTILNIRKRDVDLENGIITLKDFKNNSSYYGYITDDDLTELLLKRMLLIGNNDYVVRENGIKNISRYISRKMSSAFFALFNYDLDETDKDYRKNKVVIHTLRHTFCSFLGINGVSPFEIKQLSNHKSLSMVERYVKLNPNSGKDKVVGLYS